MKVRMLIICVWVLLPFAAPAQSQVRVSAHVDRTTVAAGESIAFEVVVENGDGQIDLSDLTEFKLYPRGTGTSVRITGARQVRRTTHSYLLLPKGKGRITVPAVTVTVDGTRFHTKPIIIEVVAPSHAEQDRQASELRVVAEVSNPTPFVGEQITYHFTLYQSVGVSEATFAPPDFDGFNAKRIKDRKPRRARIEGREYVISEIRYLLIPLSGGDKTIAPAVLNVGVVRPDKRRRRMAMDDLFARHRVEQRTLRTQALEIKVQELPPWQGPGAYSGLVGRFDLSAAIEKTDLKVGDSATLTVTLKGEGNLLDAQAPAMTFPETVKVYDDSPEEAVQLTPSGYQGHKVFRKALVPVVNGTLRLDPVKMTYFDVREKTYRELSASLPVIQVAAREEPQVTAIAGDPQGAQPQKQKVAFTGRDILPLKESLGALATQRSMPWYLFLAWLVVPAAGVGVLALVRRMGRKDMRPQARMAKRAQQVFKEAHKKGFRHPDFLGSLYQAQTFAILSRVGRMGQALTWKEAESHLAACGIPPEEARMAADYLRELEEMRFSGKSPQDVECRQMIDRSREMLKKLIL